MQDGKHGPELFVPLDGGPGPATPLDRAALEAVARAAVRRARAESAPARAAGSAWMRLPVQLAAGVALSLLVGGGAMAAGAYFRAAPEAAPAPVAARRAPADRPAEVPSLEVTLDELPEEAAHAAAPRRTYPEPAALLERANRLRADGRYGDATRLYLQVARRGKPDDAYAATVAAAALRLQHGKAPAGALQLYRRALARRPHGSLSATARYGEAECLRALGRTEAEARALEAFLAAHPGHLLRPKAEARLRALR